MSDFEFVLNRARHYCSTQERCMQEVTHKLRSWNITQKNIDKIIESLRKDNYLNEERYAKLFAGGKFRINHWGKNKIIYELTKKQVPELIIQIGLQEIGDEEYYSTLLDLLKKKKREIKDKDPFIIKKKLLNYAVQKGYHYSIAMQAANEIN
jgi:regulatory protein